MSLIFTDLRCENRHDPLGIDTVPVLSWKLSGDQGAAQTSYRVVVSSTYDSAEAFNGDVFDSGIVASDSFRAVAEASYQSSTRYFWRVEVTDQNGDKTASDVARFETALLDDSLWQGSFIGSPCANPGILLFRSHMELKNKVKSARVYVAAEGFIELYVNGGRIGTNVLEPINSDYDKQLYYVTFDVTDSLEQGDNVLGIRLNNGWATHSKFMLQAYVTYVDGTTDSFCSKAGNFVFCVSGTTIATQYSGECFNPYNEHPEWADKGDAFEKKYNLEPFGIMSYWLPQADDQRADFLEKSFHAYYTAIELPAPKGKLMATPIEPVVIGQEMKPVSCKEIKDGYLFDFGQNFTGICKIRVKGDKNTTVTLVHTELLNEDGTPNTVYLRIAEPNYPYDMQTDRFTLRGTGEVEEFMPSFTYHGFRFVAVYGLPYAPEEDTLTAYTLASDIEQIGTFKADHDMISWMQDAIMWTEKGNLHSIPTDCPQRAERQGWLNDMTARSEGAVYNLDLQLLYSKWTRDITGTQDPVTGAIGDTAPFRRGNFPADTVCSSYIYAPFLVYRHFGDDRALRENYAGFRKWVEYLFRNSDNGIAIYSLYGDWAGPEPDSFAKATPVSGITPGQYMSSCFNYYNARLMQEIARILGNTEDEAMYADRAAFMIKRLNEVYFNPETANYATGSQASNIFALELGIVPAEYQQRVADNINADIISRDYHLSTGNLCTKYLPEILTRYGHIETAMRLMEQTTYPSWGYMRSMGATTIWERWEYATGFAMNSHSHPMYGAVTAWFYKFLGGIRLIEPAFHSFSVEPYLPANIPSCSAEINSPYGKIVSAWEKFDGGYKLHVEVPVSCTASVVLHDVGSATVNGEAISGNTYTAKSGKYDFVVKY
ncbi:MAG: family 78 glycoside hydrolase catalytic domain [Clostridia bacterium]|nr:family 78 glycoside hydrolase catalytic domain [Clostridia bacterium]